MQKSAVNCLLKNKTADSLTQTWQLLKHQAHQSKTFPKVRFSSEYLPAYYSNEVTDIYHDYQDGWLVKTAIEGISGAKAFMPRSMYQQALSANFDLGDSAALDFFDSFNNRYYRLHCQTELKHNLAAQIEEERFHWANPSQSITAMLGNLCGTVGQSKKMPNSHLIQYTGVIGMKLTAIEPLKNILEDYFAARFEIEQSSVTYQAVTTCSLTQIGNSGKNQQLGINGLLGKSAVTIGQKLNIKICPKDFDHYLAVRSDKKLAGAIEHMVRTFMGINIRFNLYMKVNSQYLPRMKLINYANSESKIGQSAWMNSQNIDKYNDLDLFVELPLSS